MLEIFVNVQAKYMLENIQNSIMMIIVGILCNKSKLYREIAEI